MGAGTVGAGRRWAVFEHTESRLPGWAWDMRGCMRGCILSLHDMGGVVSRHLSVHDKNRGAPACCAMRPSPPRVYGRALVKTSRPNRRVSPHDTLKNYRQNCATRTMSALSAASPYCVCVCCPGIPPRLDTDEREARNARSDRCGPSLPPTPMSQGVCF
jgi:hypothetical protein